MTERRKILTKELKKSAGNWGKPNYYEQKNTKLPVDVEVQKYKGSKKYKKKKTKVNEKGLNHCPFCSKPLNASTWWLMSPDERAKECKNCGAAKDECPSCHRETWKSKEGIYCHEWMGCGFKGKAITRSIKGGPSYG